MEWVLCSRSGLETRAVARWASRRPADAEERFPHATCIPQEDELLRKGGIMGPRVQSLWVLQQAP